ncbi:gibberellin-regulated protein 5 isoform X1 [Setaria viridis]|uniref:Uncharacterized protein n=1 Tax=Setaria viridis TaxID=4556 RepID=A0A4U6VUR4_SETVI|nr:hypothetical protein SEVIR_2G213000v2 [Setaria viridis]
MALAGRLLILLAVAMAKHEVLARGSDEHDDNVYKVSKVCTAISSDLTFSALLHKLQVYPLLIYVLSRILVVVLQGGPGSIKSYQCSPECTRRCGNTQYRKPCLFFCNKCYNTCLCVPSGYYGNKGECPCYNNWKTKRGGPKCS